MARFFTKPHNIRQTNNKLYIKHCCKYTTYSIIVNNISRILSLYSYVQRELEKKTATKITEKNFSTLSFSRSIERSNGVHTQGLVDHIGSQYLLVEKMYSI